jgi:hypothetical protein
MYTNFKLNDIEVVSFKDSTKGIIAKSNHCDRGIVLTWTFYNKTYFCMPNMMFMQESLVIHILKSKHRRQIES